MAQRSDWLPSARQEQLNCARVWITVFTADAPAGAGKAVKKYVAWGIPENTFTELGALYGTAQEALTAAQEKETRTAVTNAACKTAFDALVAAMRNLKKRFLYVPPLTEADLVSLGLNPPDTTHTISGARRAHRPGNNRNLPCRVQTIRLALYLRYRDGGRSRQ